ncbi:MAG: 5-oxoprolinase subunit PxpB [Chloroflexi bacterium]|nr:5-oxoprolinase subunit PxpB [Chloroflexota bacterium]
MLYDNPRFFPAGDMALVAELGDAISPAINRRVRSLTDALEEDGVPGVFDFLPTYRSVLVYFDPLVATSDEVQDGIERLLQRAQSTGTSARNVVHLPTLYGGDLGPDIAFVAQHSGIDEQEVIRMHSGTDYLVYMMGFSPGFAYLGGLDERLATPRLQSPRTEIPPGAVGIAETQTGVYPVASPGGWQLIGRTPVRLFDPARERPVLLNAGDYVRFVPIESREHYDDILRQVDAGEYVVDVETEAAES